MILSYLSFFFWIVWFSFRSLSPRSKNKITGIVKKLNQEMWGGGGVLGMDVCVVGVIALRLPRNGVIALLLPRNEVVAFSFAKE